MYGTILARLAWFRDPREWGGLERADAALQLAMGEGADVAPRCKLVINDSAIYIKKGANRGVVGRREGAADLWDSEIKAGSKARDHGGVFVLQAMR